MRRNESEVALYTAFDDYVPFDPAMPERNLLRAVLLTALSDLRRAGAQKRKATQFFLSENDGYLFSFQTICELLELEPSGILKIAGLQSPPPGR